MARAGRVKYPFEADLTELGWTFNRQCRCGGTLKIYYRKKGKPNVELKVTPENRRFAVKEGNAVTLQGSLADMKTLLATI